MKVSVIVVFVVILAIAIDDTSAWRRRRRRRRACRASPCGYNWSQWTACPVCAGTRSRYAAIYRHPSCGGSGCPGSQVQACHGSCVAGAGSCSGGRCHCNAGRMGTRCETPCGANRYGPNCASSCSHCPRGCNPVSGVCNCVPSACEYSWNPWSKCDCNNKKTRAMTITKQPSCGGQNCPAGRTQTQSCDGSCVAGAGSCSGGRCHCNAGRMGTRCETPCGANRYGPNCASSCSHCPRGCNPVSGVCNCVPSACEYSWNPWSKCDCNNKKTRAMTITKQPSCGGQNCPAGRTQTQSCDGKCLKDGGLCQTQTGLCQCFSGRHGRRCDLECSSKTYGFECSRKCDQCTNGCDSKTGECKNACAYAWSPWSNCNCLGKQSRVITISQQPSSGGSACPLSPVSNKCNARVCNATGGGYCNTDTGQCECFAGRNGTTCDTTCSFGTFGVNCVRRCPQNCPNGCDSKTGECILNCQYTWIPWSDCDCMGKRSRKISIAQQAQAGGRPCPNSPEVNACEARVCDKDGGYCSGTTGDCQCYAGRNGTTCNSTCPFGTFGVNCVQKCPQKCPNGCDSKTGECILNCQYRWSPWSDCDCMGKRSRKISIAQKAQAGGRPCPNSPEVNACEARVCDKDGGICDATCGQCQCYPGRNGTKCNEKCSFGRFGVNCVNTCENCSTGCDPKTGECNCVPTACVSSWSAWSNCTCMGTRVRVLKIERPASCNGTACPSKMKDSIPCLGGGCVKGGICDTGTGVCNCPPGLMGARCEQCCPEGKYGYNCAFKCDCKHVGSKTCDAKSGNCMCNGGRCVDIKVSVNVDKKRTIPAVP